MKAIFSALIVLGSSFSASAALSPYYDSVKKIDAVLSSIEVVTAVQAAPVSQVTLVNANTAYVVAGRCQVSVLFEAILPQQPGPTTYVVTQVQRAVCN
jgi:hypothetical protein